MKRQRGPSVQGSNPPTLSGDAASYNGNSMSVPSAPPQSAPRARAMRTLLVKRAVYLVAKLREAIWEAWRWVQVHVAPGRFVVYL